MNIFIKIFATISFISILFISLLTGCTSEPIKVGIDDISTLKTSITEKMQNRDIQFEIDYVGEDKDLSNQIKKIMTEIYNSDDYLRYTSKSYNINTTTILMNTKIQFQFDYWENKEQVDYVDIKVKDILSTIITNEMNDYQKQQVIHDWIVRNVSYDKSQQKYSAYDALTGLSETVCQGYALLTYKMLNQAGIENKIIEGTADGNLHTWNLVKLDGKWYHMDTTWDDPQPDKKDKVSYDYYNLTDEEIASNHTWEKTYPKSNISFYDTISQKMKEDKNNYQFIYESLDYKYFLPEYTAKDKDALKEQIKKAINQKIKTLKVRYLDETNLNNDVNSIIENINGSVINQISSSQYTSESFLRSQETNDTIIDFNFEYY